MNLTTVRKNLEANSGDFDPVLTFLRSLGLGVGNQKVMPVSQTGPANYLFTRYNFCAIQKVYN